MTRSLAILLAAGGSAALLAAAYAFQYLGGMAPCALCYWQRYPHAAAVVLGVLALALPLRAAPARVLAALGGLAALATAGIGLYHTGVERGWWDGPSTCTAGPVGGLSTDALMAQIMSAPIVRCDAVPWEMLGLSMASWNALVSVGLAALWAVAVRGGVVLGR